MCSIFYDIIIYFYMEKIINIGFIGIGVMGKSMATHLLNKGHKLFVYNRTASKAEDLISKGAVF